MKYHEICLHVWKIKQQICKQVISCHRIKVCSPEIDDLMRQKCHA